jgi:hypothetical protein
MTAYVEDGVSALVFAGLMVEKYMGLTQLALWKAASCTPGFQLQRSCCLDQ